MGGLLIAILTLALPSPGRSTTTTATTTADLGPPKGPPHTCQQLSSLRQRDHRLLTPPLAAKIAWWAKCGNAGFMA